MSKRPPSRKVVDNLSMTDDIKSISAKKSYPVDLLKEAYIKSDKTLDRLCKEYDLPLSIVTKYVETGKWDALREHYRERMQNTIRDTRTDLISDVQSTAQRMETLKLMRLNISAAEAEAHFIKHGDFYIRDASTGKILRDTFGRPYEIKIPGDKNDFEMLERMVRVREGNMRLFEEHEKVLLEAEEQKQLSEAKNTDVLDTSITEYLEEDED